MRGLVPHQYRRRGTLIVYVAIILPVLLGLIGLASDTGYVYWTAHQLQNAADAAALAGAEHLVDSQNTALTAAYTTALANRAGGAAVQVTTQPSNPDVVIGTYNLSTGAFTANGIPANAVQVTARRTQGSPAGPLNLIFGPIVGIATSNVSRTAIAVTDTGPDAGIILLDPTASPALSMSGSSGSISVTNGSIVVDSNSSSALSWSGSPTISAPQLNINGNDTAASGVYSSGALNLKYPVVADPLAGLAAPAQPTTSFTSTTGSQPGWYKNGLSGGTLAAGIYWVDGGISLGGNSTLDASAGCLIYLHTGGISTAGNTTLILAPMTTGTYAGISVYEDRSNSSAVSMQGKGSADSVNGRMYLPAAAVSLGGNPGTLGSQLICDTLSTNGHVAVNIDYTTLQPTSHTAYLVQ